MTRGLPTVSQRLREHLDARTLATAFPPPEHHAAAASKARAKRIARNAIYATAALVLWIVAGAVLLNGVLA